MMNKKKMMRKLIDDMKSMSDEDFDSMYKEALEDVQQMRNMTKEESKRYRKSVDKLFTPLDEQIKTGIIDFIKYLHERNDYLVLEMTILEDVSKHALDARKDEHDANIKWIYKLQNDGGLNE